MCLFVILSQFREFFWEFHVNFVTARVRSTREGNVLTSVCPSIHPSVCPQGGVPISHNALQHFPECHGAVGGYLTGYPPPARVPPTPGGYPGWGVTGQVPPWGGYPGRGGTLVRYPPPGGEGWVRSSRGGGGGSGPAGGEGWVRSSRGEGGGSAKIAQHRKYLLHGGRYASCVHAGGLSCFLWFWPGQVPTKIWAGVSFAWFRKLRQLGFSR